MVKRLFQRFIPTLGIEDYQAGHDGKIHCVEARRGRGKSYFLSYLTLKCIEQRVPVLTNVDSYDFYKMALLQMRKNRGGYKNLTDCLLWMVDNITYCQTWKQILEVSDSVVILDECTTLFNARSFKGKITPPIIYEWFHQSRKVRCSVWLATHNIGWLDDRVRSVLDNFWTSRVIRSKKKFYQGQGVPVMFFLYGTDAGGVSKLGKMERNLADYRIQVPFDIRLASTYDSWEIIKTVEGEVGYESMTQLQSHLQNIGVINSANSYQKAKEQLNHLVSISPPAPSSSGGIDRLSNILPNKLT